VPEVPFLNPSKNFSVASETNIQLSKYSSLVLLANKEMNLIAKSTEASIWERHIHDSAQLLKLFPEGAKSFCDVGSGAGFPGIVLKILDQSLNCFLVEPSKKKADFMKRTASSLDLTLNIAQKMYEDLENTPFCSTDIITARALMPLSRLLDLLSGPINNGAIGIFPKGRSWEKELTEAQKKWEIKHTSFPSETSTESRIIVIEEVKRND
jgi:16S rRNA (guanine527-N7)-methyltransferase